MLPELHVLPLPTPFPIGAVNVYVAEGEPLTLIDVGPQYSPARQALIAGLGRLGYRLEDVRQIVLTHHHYEENGVPPDIIAALARIRQDISRFVDPLPHRVYALAEGETVFFAKRPWKIFHTPGHAGGLICLWEKESRTLLCNDHLLREVSSNAMLEPPASPDQPRPKRLVEYLQHGVDWFLGLSEVQGHLDWLEQEGEAKLVSRYGLSRWGQM